MKLNLKERFSKATDAVLDFNARKAGKMLAYPVTAPVKAIKAKQKEREEEAWQELADRMTRAVFSTFEQTQEMHNVDHVEKENAEK